MEPLQVQVQGREDVHAASQAGIRGRHVCVLLLGMMCVSMVLVWPSAPAELVGSARIAGKSLRHSAILGNSVGEHRSDLALKSAGSEDPRVQFQTLPLSSVLPRTSPAATGRVGIPGGVGRPCVPCTPRSRTALAPAGALRMKTDFRTSDVDVKEYIKIFGRLGEKMLFGDASAGLCCHSACDDCEWRYSFDVLQSARPKWIPTYRENRFEDGREHIAKWSSLFDGDEPVGKEQFCERLVALKFDMPLGPSGYLTAKQADVSEEGLEAFWHHMSRGKPTLSPKQMQIRLRKMLMPDSTSDQEGVMWPDFIDSMTEDEEKAEAALEEAIIVG